MQEMWSLLRETFTAWYEDRASRLGAALAYYTIFALAPGLIIVIGLAGLLTGWRAESQIIERFRELIGEQGATAIEATIRSARIATLGKAEMALALATLVVGLWGVLGELQDGLNTIWGITPKRGRHVIDIVKERFWSFAMVVGIGFLVLVSLALSAWLAALGTYVGYLLPAPPAALEALNFVISVAVIMASFALISKLLPDVSIAWRDVWLGAAVTSLFFTIGKFLIGLYLGKSAVASAYGAAGSLVIIVVWVYYSAQIPPLWGQIYQGVGEASWFGSLAREKTAVPVTEKVQPGQGHRRRRKEAAKALRAGERIVLRTFANHVALCLLPEAEQNSRMGPRCGDFRTMLLEGTCAARKGGPLPWGNRRRQCTTF